MILDLEKFYICWSPRILAGLLDAGFKLWKDPDEKQNNPFLDLKQRFDKNGILKKQKTGYVFERTPKLMELVGKYSKQQI